MRFTPALFLAGCAACVVPSASSGADAGTLAAAESAFAAHSVREGMRAAFMAHFEREGVFVREGWVNARDWLAPRPEPAIVLDWRPVYVEVAASGEMGLSTGPWRLSARLPDGKPPAHGQFISIWRRDRDGTWKVAVDLGISHADPWLWDSALETVDRATTRTAGDSEGIVAAEARFAALARESGPSAYEAHASDQVRLYRPGVRPVLGKRDALATLATADGRIAWKAERIETARSGEFGYVRGSYASAKDGGEPLGHFLRVWRREAVGWRIALDVTNPAKR